MKPFTVPGLLRAAASYIEIHGHEQRLMQNGGVGSSSGPCCPVAACIRLRSNEQQMHKARVALSRAVPGQFSWFLGIWSDHTPTAEVLATMRRVARELDAQ